MLHSKSPTPCQYPSQLDGCLAFWDFNRTLRPAIGPGLILRPQTAEPDWVEGGVFGSSSLRIRKGRSLSIPRGQLGPLNIFGPKAEVSVCAWIFRESEAPWQALAGVWDETRSKRQYCLFLNAISRSEIGRDERVPCQNRVHGHISDVGGPTPGNVCCISYATGGTEIPLFQWTAVGMTAGRDGIRLYVNGKLDVCDQSNPFPMSDSIFDGGEDGADFTVGANSVRGGPGNCFGGLFGGLAVYNRALRAEEMQLLQALRA
ncbi:MAG: LamG domain-containing protein [Verrucomicrobia bacterium]|nr:LamG domain-containing protein [Verrucomicrobiota bacterium]MCH8527283.1 LamG domain-containing protein [Kiritimatiellia bacterium]